MGGSWRVDETYAYVKVRGEWVDTKLGRQVLAVKHGLDSANRRHLPQKRLTAYRWEFASW